MPSMAPSPALKGQPAKSNRRSTSTPTSPVSRPSHRSANTAPTSPNSRMGATKRKVSQNLSEPTRSPAKRTKTHHMGKSKSIVPEDDGSTPQSSTPSGTESGEISYLIECPARVSKRYNSKDDAFRGIEDGGVPNLSVVYAIRPGTPWNNMNPYKRVRLYDYNFQRGDYAYFARKLSPAEETTDDEIIASNDPLAFERENMWIGMITEARAVQGDGRHVYLRILYAYWPEELPQGRQPYHGIKEVIMSNHMDILDAHTITGKVDVQHILNEKEENLGGLYWRQTLNVKQVEKGLKAPGILSKLEAHCICQEPCTPDRPMFICRANEGSCGLWNHEKCLIDDILDDAWTKHEEGTLGDGGDDPRVKDEQEQMTVVKSEKSPLRRVASTVVGLMAGAFLTPEAESETEKKAHTQFDGPSESKATFDSKSTIKREKKQKHTTGETPTWEGKFSAAIDSTGKWGRDDVVMAQVTDDFDGRVVWTTPVACLGCQEKLE